jgi:hypothetical protein
MSSAIPDLSEEDWERVAQMVRQLLEGSTCPFCQMPITARIQKGRCVYADPCGHRLYQGIIPKESSREK